MFLPLKKWCCCVSLRAGSLLTGYIGIIFFSISLYNSYQQQEPKLRDNLQIILNTVSFIFNIILVYGLHKNQPKIILTWLIVKFLIYSRLSYVFGETIYLALKMIMELDQKNFRAITLGLISIFFLVLSLTWYSYICVLSYYLVLSKKGKTDKGDEKQAKGKKKEANEASKKQVKEKKKEVNEASKKQVKEKKKEVNEASKKQDKEKKKEVNAASIKQDKGKKEVTEGSKKQEKGKKKEKTT